MRFRLGKNPKRVDKRTLQFGRYLLPSLPPPPQAIDWTKAVTIPWGMMLNNLMGDCTCAAAGHLILTWTANANPPAVVVPDAAIQTAYSAVDGGVDRGADMLTVLNYWKATGIGGNVVSSFMEVSPQSQVEVENAIAVFGGCYLGVALPDAVLHGDELANSWTQTYGPPNQNNGHCIPLVGYSTVGPVCVTWGTVKQMSWEFLKMYGDEAYAILSPQWVNAGGQSPEGINLTALQADLAEVTGQ